MMLTTFNPVKYINEINYLQMFWVNMEMWSALLPTLPFVLLTEKWHPLTLHNYYIRTEIAQIYLIFF